MNEIKEQSRWNHRNGGSYTVLYVANSFASEENKEKYPETVVYQGTNGKIWARLASDWHRSFSEAV